ncbi:O-acetylhomoserine sulfhydrylase [Candidatus Syntrophocurvum alkaliphilum]|uniref:O-acetylhomoserine sulfhydrylase n=1 Tax=Candidatus Syntrophocurvum alkaliphilum TaxID=2293317 RepID=A0A6I6DGK6_9FIRM|nr:O-acetylhomoserine aminocarboxypropyltransferase/cysteine synthase family protein [Candidatus Syntrophocurvum alkaliphilum]QGU00227.1 O-acetylhomoserine sulfhydrylase [Candidatus Syntrophocurvum alkaliphilum]
MSDKWGFNTKSVQGGWQPKAGEPRVLPIYQSTTYKQDDPDFVADLFDLKENGFFYTRLANPTLSAFEEKISLLEGGVGAVSTSSGQAAIMYALLNICQAGEHIVTASTLYGGTHTLMASTFKKFGVEVTFVDPDLDAEEIKKHFKPETKALYGETIGNPRLNVLDFKKFSKIAEEMKVPLIVDNTFPTPYLCRPLEHGANIVVHSATKYIDGQATSLGGVIVDGGNFNWNNGKFPELSEPDPSYHGLKYWETFGNQAYIVKARVQLLRDMGSVLSPFNAFLLNLGTETLSLRMAKHSENTLKLAEYLNNHDKVEWVWYPLLKNHPSYELAKRYLPLGASGMLSFGIKGGNQAGKKFISNVELASLVVHLGDARTSVIHPASTTHRQLTKAEQEASGVAEDLIRVSVGIEDIEDIIADFEQALNKAVG